MESSFVLFMNISMLWINQEKRRSYRVCVYQDLLGDWVMVCSLGALDTSHDGSKADLVDVAKADDLLIGIDKLRVKKGYVNVEK